MPNYAATSKNRTITAWLAVLLFALIAAAHLLRSAYKGSETLAIICVLIFFIVAIFLRLGRQRDASTLAPRFIPWSTIPIILLAIWAVNARLFGKFDVSAAIFHMQHGLDYDGVGDDIAEFALFLLIAALLIAAIIYLARRDSRVKMIERLIALPLLLINPLILFAVDKISLPFQEQITLKDYYVEAKLPETQQPAKNLLLIYLESMESTFAQPEFGSTYDDLETLSKQGLRLHGVKQIEDTGWTIAGMVASQCGTPLLSYGLIMQNRMKNISSFLPKADCLATHLRNKGYTTSYLGAAELKFAGKGRFLETHGYDKRVGMDEIPLSEQNEKSEWGIYDDKLFELAETELERLSQSGKPFFYSILTLGGHSPAGYPAPSCYNTIEDAHDMDTLLLSIACTARLTRNFLSKAKAQGWLDNTTIILLSDHYAMQNTQYDKLTKLNRENFVLIIDPDIAAGEREVTGSMIDLYPTILEAIGLPSANGEAGLGRSLLRADPTLLQQLESRKLNKAITSDTELRKHLWDIQ